MNASGPYEAENRRDCTPVFSCAHAVVPAPARDGGHVAPLTADARTVPPRRTACAFDQQPGVVLAACIAPAWALGIHDAPTVWVTVFAYVAAVVLCLRAAKRDRVAMVQSPPEHRAAYAPWFWLATAALLAALAINKPLDLHTLITEFGRQLAQRGGWYGDRRRVQLLFVAAVGAASLLALATTVWRLRLAALRRCALSLAGLWLMAVFVGLRVVSFHHADVFLGRRLHGFKLHWLLELLAIAVIAAGAVVAHPPKQAARQ